MTNIWHTCSVEAKNGEGCGFEWRGPYTDCPSCSLQAAARAIAALQAETVALSEEAKNLTAWAESNDRIALQALNDCNAAVALLRDCCDENWKERYGWLADFNARHHQEPKTC